MTTTTTKKKNLVTMPLRVALLRLYTGKGWLILVLVLRFVLIPLLTSTLAAALGRIGSQWRGFTFVYEVVASSILYSLHSILHL